jgi:hypothetical protein
MVNISEALEFIYPPHEFKLKEHIILKLPDGGGKTLFIKHHPIFATCTHYCNLSKFESHNLTMEYIRGAPRKYIILVDPVWLIPDHLDIMTYNVQTKINSYSAHSEIEFSKKDNFCNQIIIDLNARYSLNIPLMDLITLKKTSFLERWYVGNNRDSKYLVNYTKPYKISNIFFKKFTENIIEIERHNQIKMGKLKLTDKPFIRPWELNKEDGYFHFSHNLKPTVENRVINIEQKENENDNISKKNELRNIIQSVDNIFLKYMNNFVNNILQVFIWINILLLSLVYVGGCGFLSRPIQNFGPVIYSGRPQIKNFDIFFFFFFILIKFIIIIISNILIPYIKNKKKQKNKTKKKNKKKKIIK